MLLDSVAALGRDELALGTLEAVRSPSDICQQDGPGEQPNFENALAAHRVFSVRSASNCQSGQAKASKASSTWLI